MIKKIRNIFELVVKAVYGLILIFIVLAIAIGTVQLFWSVSTLFLFKGITGQYIYIISDVLTLYVLIELSRTLMDYFDSHRLRITFIVDAAIVFIIREILIDYFKEKLEPIMLISLSVFLFVLAILRICSVLLYTREKTITADHD